MEDSLKIKVTIADRVYPINVNGVNEEEGVRKAANKINELVANFEKNYAVSDKQDVLAMCALQFASLVEVNSINKDLETNEATKKLNQLNALLDEHLDK